MEKSEMMKRYEEETGFTDAIVMVKIGLTKLYFPSPAYVQWFEERFAKSEAKASAYDRLMSGGKKTLKEWANLLGMNFAVNRDGDGTGFKDTPEVNEHYGFWLSDNGCSAEIPCSFIDFNGDWKDSLTLPDGWEKKQVRFRNLDSKVVVIKDGYDVAEITSDGFHVTQYNPTFSYKEMKQITQKMKQESLPDGWEDARNAR